MMMLIYDNNLVKVKTSTTSTIKHKTITLPGQVVFVLIFCDKCHKLFRSYPVGHLYVGSLRHLDDDLSPLPGLSLDAAVTPHSLSSFGHRQHTPVLLPQEPG
jgi:hypothetical protein